MKARRPTQITVMPTRWSSRRSGIRTQSTGQTFETRPDVFLTRGGDLHGIVCLWPARAEHIEGERYGGPDSRSHDVREEGHHAQPSRGARRGRRLRRRRRRGGHPRQLPVSERAGRTRGADGKGGGAQMVRAVDGNGLPAKDGKVYMLRSYHSAAHEIWDVTDPSNPKGVRTVRDGNPLVGAQTGAPGALATTHKSWWEPDTGIAYVVGSRGSDKDAGWRTGHHIMVYDLSNPAQPKFLRDWALDGQQPRGKIPPYFKEVPNIHGPISTGPAGNRIYMAYGTGENGVMQIVDRAKLLSSAPTDYTSAEVGRWVMNPDNGGHTSFPLGKMTVPDRVIDTGNQKAAERDIVVVVSEATQHFGDEPRHVTTFVDVTTEGRPQSIATFQVLASSGGSGEANFIDRGGRFGPHATNEEMGPPFYKKVVFVSYFNAGLRAIDVRDPYNPKEVAYFIPETTQATDKRVGKLKGQENVA